MPEYPESPPAYTQEQLKAMYEAARAQEPAYKDLTFVSLLVDPGTQGNGHRQALARDYGLKLIVATDLVREEADDPASPLAPHILRAVTTPGARLDDDVVFAVVRRHVDAAVSEGHTRFLFFGFPATVPRLRRFERTIGPFKLVIHMVAIGGTFERWLQREGAALLARPDGGAAVRSRAAAVAASLRPISAHLIRRATNDRMFCRIAVIREFERVAFDVRRAVEDAGLRRVEELE